MCHDPLGVAVRHTLNIHKYIQIHTDIYTCIDVLKGLLIFAIYINIKIGSEC